MSEDNKSSILIIDDEQANRLMLINILDPDEYTVYVRKSGLEGIEAAEELLPDIILLDILMPEMDGYEVISALKASHKTKHIPVIFITGLSEVSNEEKGLSLGAVDYITKPFSPNDVRRKILNHTSAL